ncbi:MAG: glycosyl transferase, group 1/2 family protein [Clostridia bacterium]|jgi:hypothetical protein|nr:glycosyl transferase, group 1/2 family protein [Clostridia bacterium]
MLKDLAPIALFVYNRIEHTLKTIEALKKNGLAKESDLIIYSDGPKKEADLSLIAHLRSEIRKTEGFNSITVIERENNIGLANSIISGVTELINDYGKIIVLEDDCVPSEDFLYFMNMCLDKYAEEEQIMSISGYSLPIEVPEDYPYDIYFSYRSSSWGWGTWEKAWKYYDRDPAILKKISSSRDLRDKVDRAGKDLYPMLRNQIKGKLDSWSVFWSINIIMNDGLCINPVYSRILNIGHDGTGIHCNVTSKYDVNTTSRYDKNIVLPESILIDERIQKRYRAFLSESLFERVINFSERLIKRHI